MNQNILNPSLITGDEVAIQQIVSAVEESWNRHDMAAFAALLTDNVEWVNPVGM